MLRTVLCVAVLGLLSGCDSGPELVPVTGKVTIDGEPLAYKSLMFFPEEGTPGNGGGGNTQKDGSYELIASIPGSLTDEMGVPAGRYKVIVFEPTIPITEDLEVASDDPSELTPAVSPTLGRRRTQIPKIYGDRETTPLVLDVPPEGGVLEVKLSSNPG
jgi:hypothetical protein